METRNPSPPPNFNSVAEENDHIGDSAYSKRWLHSLILQVLTQLSNIGEVLDDSEEELEQLLEDDLCKLWDITSDQSLLEPLRHFNLVPVFTECIQKSKNPRLIEISLGILANISLDDEQCAAVSDDPSYIANVLGLLSTSDTRILIELFRLLRAVLSSRNNRQVWLDAIHFTPEFMERVNFILVSSTSAQLLMSTINALETILRIDDSIGELWCNTNLLGSLQVAQHQMGWIHGNEVETLYRIVYIFSTNSTGVRTLMSRVEDVYPNIGVLLRKVCEDEPHLIPFEQYNTALRLILPVIDVIIANLPTEMALASFHFDKDILPCLLQIIIGCIRQNLISGEITLDGLWEDLSGLFSDLILRVHEYLQSSETGDELPEESNDLLHWLKEIEEGSAEMRSAFVRCCLYRRVQVITEGINGGVSYNSNSSTAVEVLRGQLVFVCQRLRLPRILECSTTDHE